MRKIFIVVILIIYAGLAFAYLNMPQIATAQMELPTNTNITLLNETVSNNTVSDATNDATRMDENAKP
jgi:regulatory protein YycI of two-component signal transduction system YycFG